MDIELKPGWLNEQTIATIYESIPSLQDLLQEIGFSKFEAPHIGYWGIEQRFYLESRYEKFGPYSSLEELRRKFYLKLGYVYHDKKGNISDYYSIKRRLKELEG